MDTINKAISHIFKLLRPVIHSITPIMQSAAKLISPDTANFAHAITEVFDGAVFSTANSFPSILSAAALLALCVPNKVKIIMRLNAIDIYPPIELVLIADIKKLNT